MNRLDALRATEGAREAWHASEDRRELRRPPIREECQRIMRQKGLVGRGRRRWTKTATISDPETRAVDLLGSSE